MPHSFPTRCRRQRQPLGPQVRSRGPGLRQQWHQPRPARYLSVGGLGFLLGDGKLNYSRENIVESFYTLHAWRGIFPAFGLQYVVHPGYNIDRGPVVVPTLRLHLEF